MGWLFTRLVPKMLGPEKFPFFQNPVSRSTAGLREFSLLKLLPLRLIRVRAGFTSVTCANSDVRMLA
jgi:hypothetical protein